MAAKFSKWVIAVVIGVAPLGCAAERDDSANAKDVERMLSRDLAASTATLRDRIEACEKKASSSEVPELEQEKLSDLEAEREQLLTALGHLHFRNSFECEREARETVAFRLGMLEMVRDKHGEEADASQEVREGLIYPSIEQLRYRQRYESLPEKLRVYIEGEVGSQPFNLMTALKKNGLVKD